MSGIYDINVNFGVIMRQLTDKTIARVKSYIKESTPSELVDIKRRAISVVNSGYINTRTYHICVLELELIDKI